jgi:hypothetical protein
MFNCRKKKDLTLLLSRSKTGELNEKTTPELRVNFVPKQTQIFYNNSAMSNVARNII